MSQTILQVQIDSSLNEEVSRICQDMGLDITTAVKLFLTRVKLTNSLPFEVSLPEEFVVRQRAKKAFEEIRRQTASLPEMTLDEINAEIAAARAERKARSVRQ